MPGSAHLKKGFISLRAIILGSHLDLVNPFLPVGCKSLSAVQYEMTKSKLPNSVLTRIWKLSDVGKVTKSIFLRGGRHSTEVAFTLHIRPAWVRILAQEIFFRISEVAELIDRSHCLDLVDSAKEAS